MRLRRRWKSALFILGGIVLLLGWLVLDMLVDSGAFRTIEPHFEGRCERVDEVMGSEDIVLDPIMKRAYLSYQDFRSLKQTERAEPGAIASYDLERGGAPVKVAMDFPQPFHPHGLSFFRSADGERRLFIVNHPDRNTSHVEIFAVEGVETPTLRHLRTVTGPEMISINDVVAVGLDQFYATNDAGTRADDALRTVETVLRLPWASVLYFDDVHFTTVVEGLTYANGIAVSADGRAVYVAETTGRKLSIYDRDVSTGELTLRSSKVIPSGLDNLSIANDGSIWIGAHPKMFDFLAHSNDPTALSPSQIFRATVDGTSVNVEEIFLDDGRQISGSSVALPVGSKRFIIGTVFQEHFLDCRVR